MTTSRSPLRTGVVGTGASGLLLVDLLQFGDPGLHGAACTQKHRIAACRLASDISNRFTLAKIAINGYFFSMYVVLILRPYD